MIKQRFPLAKGKAHKKTPSDGRKDLDATNKLGRFFLGRVNVKMLSYWQTQIQRQRQTQRQWQKQAQRHTQRFWMLMVSAPVSSGRAQSRPPLLVSGRPDPPLASESPPPPSSLSLSLSLSWWGRSSVSPARKATACRCSPGLQLPRGQTHTLNCCCCFCLHFLSSKIVLSKMSSWCNILNSLFDHVWSNLLMVKWHCCSSSGLNCLFQIEISLSFNILPSPAESSFLLALNALRRRRGSLPHQSRNTSASVF